MTVTDYLALTGREPSARIAYGPGPSQYAELFQPAGQGPFPVVVLAHGGCWTKAFQGIVQMRDMAGALAALGVAVWNVDYRCVDEPGGGYPGTYHDINAALAALAANAERFRLDTRRIVAVGHSAGGHLAQWIAGRDRLPATSPLRIADPLPIRQIISLGGLNDLRRQAVQIRTGCGIDVARLTGDASAERPDPFADTSPAELVPNGTHTVLINGERDAIAPPALAAAFAERARAAGDTVETIILADAGHYDLVATGSPAWTSVLPILLRAVAATWKWTETISDNIS